MPNLKYTKTFEHPPLTPVKAVGLVVLGILILLFIWAISAFFFSSSAPFPIMHQGFPSTDVRITYTAVLIWFGFGCAMFLGVLIINYVLAPWNRWRKLYVPDEAYTNSTYECGENPVGEGHTQTNLQYYTFAIVFVIFDIITTYILLFSLVINGITGLDLALQVLGVGVFSVIPLLILGFWLHKKAILWQ